MSSHARPPFSPAAARDADALAAQFAQLVVAAGALVMEVASRARIDVRLKNDRSPVCEADERAEAFLLDALERLLPGVPAIAEESAARGVIPPAGAAFLLIDPLDGTREFVARGPEYTINVALVENGAPRAGAIHAPALGGVWFAGTRAYFAPAAPGAELPGPEYWRPLETRRRPPEGMVALVSKTHLDPRTQETLARLNVRESRPMASSLKFCRLAEGAADVYPRFGVTMEWDIAAGHAILKAAGGDVLDPCGAPFRYGKAAQFYRNGPFVAWADPQNAMVS